MASVGLINRVKYSRAFYSVYYFVGTLVIKLLKALLKPDSRLILFTSYSGKKYDDSPKDVYEAMLKDRRFEAYRMVWAFRQPERFKIERGTTVKTDTLQYYKTLIKARAWVSNNSVTRGLSFRGLNTFSINSWHGTPIKLIGRDVLNRNGGTFIVKGKEKTVDIQLAQGEYEKRIYARAFGLREDQVVITGLPRNDSLVYDNNPEKIVALKNSFGFAQDKRVILYAPTYRDYEKDEGKNCVLKPPFDLEKWRRQLGNDYILLIRAHQEVVKVLDLQEDSFVRNASNLPILNDLLLATDILISDYSGILFDYSILGRPIYCYTYDYEKYKKARGMYFDIRMELPSTDNEDELINMIKTYNHIDMEAKVKKFRKKYVKQYGNASQKALDVIFNAIGTTNGSQMGGVNVT